MIYCFPLIGGLISSGGAWHWKAQYPGGYLIACVLRLWPWKNGCGNLWMVTPPKMNECPLKKNLILRGNSSSNHHFYGDMLVFRGVNSPWDFRVFVCLIPSPGRSPWLSQDVMTCWSWWAVVEKKMAIFPICKWGLQRVATRWGWFAPTRSPNISGSYLKWRNPKTYYKLYIYI